MGFFSFLKKKPALPIKTGAGPMKLDINLPPVEPVKPHPSAPETPEVPSAIPPLDTTTHYPAPPPPSEHPSAFREAESYRGEIATKDLARSLDLVSAKLDAIKLMIENVNHRLDKLEEEKKKETIRW